MKSKKDDMPTTTQLTEKYIKEHPSIKDCLKNGVINYSKLSRKIAKELGIEKKTSMEAILIACRRFSEKLKKEKVQEKQIISLLKNSELAIKNKILVAIVDKQIYIDHLQQIQKKIRAKADTFYAIEGTSVITIIVSEKYLDDINKLFEHDIMKITKNCALINLKSPQKLENTPGVNAYLCSLFAENGINIYETLSCWTDTMFVVAEDDVGAIMQFLKF